MKHMILVDDSADQLELMRLALAAMDVDAPVATFSSAEACLAAVEAGDVQPGVVVIDVHMPGLDGPEAVARLRRLPAARNARIAVMSTSDLRSDVQRALQAGADLYLLKPGAGRSWREMLADAIHDPPHTPAC